jgi:hypothetical protein
MDALEEVIKWTGVSVAFLGAVLSSPDGAKRLVRDIWKAIRTTYGYRSQSANVNAPTAISSHGSGSDSFKAELMWGPDSPLDQRIQILLGRIEGLSAVVDEVRAELSGRLDQHSQKIAGLTRAIDEASAACLKSF